ncbi:MAG: type II secretion system ATPase GspE [Oligoflexia bacterium]|nr:type II secretion system ATPase GspE [Oligoflexia bacterium]
MTTIENIGSLLLKSSSMSEAQLNEILQIPLEGGQKLAEKMITEELATPDDALKQLCGHLKLDFMKEIPFNDIPIDLVRDLPINYAKQYGCLPFKMEQETLKVLISNPASAKTLDDLRALFNKRIIPIVSSATKIQDAINKVYEKSTAAFQGLEGLKDDEAYDFDEPIDLLEAGDDDAPVIKLVNSLLFRSVKDKASDIHIEPYERDMVVRFRIDGVLYDVFKPPKSLQSAITSRIKVMANLNIAEKRLPQDGRIPIKMAGKDIDIRLSTVPTSHGERIVMRLQDRSNVILELPQLGFSDQALTNLVDLVHHQHGIMLVTGPTGSGKSTTLYACIMAINNVERNIITIEDPVEQRIHGIGQIQVNSKINLTFANGLRAILRQDPDVIMVGEIRDLETAEIAINSSLTGHLVLSTIHTNDAAGAIPRLIDMGCEPFLVASSLLGIVAQRLIRVLCPHCKVPHDPTDAELASIELTRADLGQGRVFKAQGCNQCNQKGYLGRTVIHELLVITEPIRQLILQNKDSGTIKRAAQTHGMKTLREDGAQKVLRGITTIEELISTTQEDI